MRGKRDFPRRGTFAFVCALLPVVFAVGCSHFYTVEVSNYTDVPVVVELTQYDDFYGKRPTEFTGDLLRATEKVRVSPGETVEVTFNAQYEWVVWRQAEPIGDAQSGILSLDCDCREVTLGQKTWREVTPSEWGDRAYRLLARPVGYIAAVWFVLLLWHPRWALSRRWSPVRATVLKPTAYYRVFAVVWLIFLLLFVLLPQRAGVAYLARLSILIAVAPILTAWWLAACARVLLPRPVLESDSRFGRGFPGVQRRTVPARAASFVTLLIASVLWWTTTHRFDTPIEPDLAPYESFFALPLAEQRRAIRDYPLGEQIDVYLTGERQCLGSELESELALNAEDVVTVLAERLAGTEDRFEALHIFDFFAWLEGSGSYLVADDEDLMKTLDSVAGRPGWNDSYLEKNRVTDIREHGERRRAAASVASPGPLE